MTAASHAGVEREHATGAEPERGAVAGAVAALGGGEIASRVVAFGTATLLAHRLGPEGFGVLGFAAALCGYFAIAVGGGLSDLAARDVARRPQDASAIYRSVAAIRLPLALLSLAALAALAWWTPRPPLQQLVIALSGLSMITLAIDPSWALKALGRSVLASSGLVVAQAIALAIVIVAVAGPGDVVVVPVAQFGADAVTAIVLVSIALRGASRAFSWSDGMTLLRDSTPLLVGRIMRTVIVSFDMVMLGVIASNRDVGLYAAVYRLHFFVLALVSAVQAAHLPLMARAHARGSQALARATEDALAGAAVVGAPIVFGGLVTAGPLLAFLFGRPYDEGARALQWLLVSLLFVFVHALLHNVYVATDRNQIETRWFGAAAAVNVAANLVLIPRYGIAGAAAATALAEGLIMAGGVFVSGAAPLAAVCRAWIKPACAAAAMAIVVWALRESMPVVAQCAVGAIVYGVVLVVLVGPKTAAQRLGVQRP